MPRIRQNADRDVMADFVSELNAQRARFGYDTQRTLGAALDVCQATAGNYIRNPETIPFGVLRKMIKLLKPDPILFLKAVGYSSTDIKRACSFVGGSPGK